MTNRNAGNRITTNEIFVLALLALIFTAVNVIYSTHYGRLAIPPTYDDIGFISNGLTLLDAGYQHGWGRWLTDFFTKTWHSPVAAFQACLAFALFGKAAWAPYLLNGLYLTALLICLRKELHSFSIPAFLVIAFSILAWPLTSYLIVEFRPDIATNLFLALGTWRLANRHEQIGLGQCRRFRPAWEITWPFLLALWLKPSFSPVVIGLWLAAWVFLCVINHLIFKKEAGLRNSLNSFVLSGLILLALFFPYLIVSGSHLANYFITNIFSGSQDIWSPPLSTADNLKYYVIGEGGRATMKWWSIVTFAVALCAALAAGRSKDYGNLRKGGIYAVFTIVAWTGMTILKNKSPWFGSVVSSHFLVVFILATAYLFGKISSVPAAYRSFATVLVVLGVTLHSWPNLSGVLPGLGLNEIPSYAREAKRVFADTCNAIQGHAGGDKVSILMPSISLMLNPDLIELCGIERDSVPTEAPRIYMRPYSQVLANIQSSIDSGEANMLALVLSSDFPGIPGNMPTSKHMGSLNRYFYSSGQFKLTELVHGPNGTGSVQIFKKISAFSPTDNVTGMKEFEGPYPDKKLPVVRWTLFPTTEFDIKVVPGHRTRLDLSGLPALTHIIATVRLSGGEQKVCEFVASVFSNCHVDFVPESDRVHVKIEPRDARKEASTPRTGEAILLSRIAVVDMDMVAAKKSQRSDSPFSDIDFLEGFGNVEGPYKKWNLPVIVWGHGNFSKIGVAGEIDRGGALLIEWRPGETVQAFDILQKDISIGRCAAGATPGNFSRCEFQLSPSTPPNDLILRYVGNQKILSNKMNNSALFRRIQFIERNDPLNFSLREQ